MRLWLDCETRCILNLKTVGTPRYATLAELLTAQWAIDDGQTKVWVAIRGDKPPSELILAILESDEIWAHNAFFDRSILLGRQSWWPKSVGLSKFRCVMAQLLSHGLPGGLEKACEIFKVDALNAKLDGRALIQLFCVPRKDGSWATEYTHPEKWKEFLAYAKQDVPAMRAVSLACPKWNYGNSGPVAKREVGLWHLDQKVNDRGFAIDKEFALNAVRATEAEKKRLGDRTVVLTDGEVERTTQRDRLIRHLLLEYGVELPNLKADTIERRLEDPELPEFVKELLRIRLLASKASTSKYKRLLQMEVGGRLMGTLQFCAANRTGRWGGRGFQPQNMPRPSHKFAQIMRGINAFKLGAEVELIDDIMELASSALRSTIVAGPGKKLVVSDLSNIEGRMTAWLAGEDWKLEAFAAFDRKEGPDLYKVAYGRSFGADPDSIDDDCPERQIGKVQELSLGYEGGVGAYATMAVTYHVDLEEMAIKARPAIPAAVYREAERTYIWMSRKGRDLGLSKDVFVCCESLKSLWRAAHPMIVGMWEEHSSAARNAILYPNTEFKAGRIVYDRIGAWLRMRLPSGRCLCYPNPKLDGGVISYMGGNVYNKRWHRITTYGGKLVENAVQAASRDIIADAMPRAEAAGYQIVLTCHDEIMSEAPTDEEFNDAGLSGILATNPLWAPGIPLAAKGFTSDRYRKG